MSSPYDQLDAGIKHLIRQGCSPNAVSQQSLNQYPQLVNQAAQVLKQTQAIERIPRTGTPRIVLKKP